MTLKHVRNSKFDFKIFIVILTIMLFVVSVHPPIAWAEDNLSWDELRGWAELKNNTILVMIHNGANINEEKVDIIRDVIYSKKTNSEKTLFYGWNEAIREISESVKTEIPLLQIQDKLYDKSPITIYLTENSSAQNHHGYTNIFYDHNGKITKAIVTLYNTSQLSDNQLEVLIRHELGHALGLGHTSIKNDLMNKSINMHFGTISYADLSALVHIYPTS